MRSLDGDGEGEMNIHFVDVTSRSIVRMTGRESLDLLQRISTNDVLLLKSGEKVQTILTNDKGRIVDVVSIFPRGVDDLLLAGSNPIPGVLKGWIEKFIIMEDITITDVTSLYFQLILFGPKEQFQDIQPRLGPECIIENWGSTSLQRLIGESASCESTVRYLNDLGIGRELPGMFEEYRISNGIPAFPSELSTSYNPLEAGLENLINWTKGCYVGQEVIARLDTYKKVQRKMVRLKLDKRPGELPAVITSRSNEVGVLTSASTTHGDEGFVGLGYIKTSFLQTPDELSISGPGQVVHVTLPESEV